MNTVDAFAEITSTNYIIESDILNLMTQYNKKCDKNGAECLIKRMDLNKDGKVDYIDF